MSVIKCKMCGGTLEINAEETVAVCEYCGTKQTLPKIDDDKKANLYDRAGHFRRNNEFDKAMAIYEQILNDDAEDAEPYWSLILCRYGIEYVEDPATHKRVPTVNRAQFTSVLADEDYKSAIKYADSAQREVYEAEAHAIDEIQKGILAISQKEEPFDIFICYKETDANGRRTPDSVLATELYHELTKEGFKVFFSRITLEDKLGTAYEPYIFAALNSAKVMVALGTKAEYFNAVWVKNEWSRYLALIKNGAKKTLIPAYRDMDPYDLPDEFSHLQAQDMAKLGFMQDLTRGIKKIIGEEEKKESPKEKETVVVQSEVGGNVAALLDRGFMALEDGEWDRADDFFEQALNFNAKLPQAYLGKLMAVLKVHKQEDLKNCEVPFDKEKIEIKCKVCGEVFDIITNHEHKSTTCKCPLCKSEIVINVNSTSSSGLYEKIIRFASPELADTLDGYIKFINERNENARLTALYEKAVKAMQEAKTEKDYKAAAEAFKKIPGFRDADKKVKECLEKAEVCRKEEIYRQASGNMTVKNTSKYEKAIELFKTIPGYKDADEHIYACQKKIEEIKAKEEADRLEAERKAEERRIAAEKAAKKRKKAFAIGTPIVAACIAFVIVLTTVIIPSGKYNSAMELYNAGKYQDAYTAFNKVSYKDSKDKASECLFLVHKSNLSGIKKGDTVKFGFYEQDNNTTNGKEEIEWIVLNVEGSKALVVSKYALDCQQYNTSYTDVTWESCSLRKWMNNTFTNEAFGSQHQEMILDTNVSADKNPKYSTNPGNATTDKVFLLSITEAEKYFTTDESRKCAPTAYAKSQGACTNDSYKTASGEATCWWWLRSPGHFQPYAAGVSHGGGSVLCYGDYVNNVFGCVRPAMWVNIGE